MNQIFEIIQSPNFAKLKKKLNKNQVKFLDAAIKEIIENPAIGDMKSGDLHGVSVYKYKVGNSQILLAYEVVGLTIFLYSFGSHQNFYRELSKYLHK